MNIVSSLKVVTLNPSSSSDHSPEAMSPLLLVEHGCFSVAGVGMQLVQNSMGRGIA